MDTANGDPAAKPAKTPKPAGEPAPNPSPGAAIAPLNQEQNDVLDAIIPGDKPQERLPDPRTPEIRRAILRGCVAYMKANTEKVGTGARRDDAAAQFVAGAVCAASGLGVDIAPPSEPVTYLACLEALAD